MSNRQDLIILNSAMTQLMRRIRQVDEAQGIGRARLSALAVLHFGGECSLTELAEAELVSRATMHHVVNGLEREAYVKRTTDPNDARRQIIKLTRQGKTAIEEAHKARISYLDRLTSDMDPLELSAAAKALDQLRNEARTELL